MCFKKTIIFMLSVLLGFTAMPALPVNAENGLETASISGKYADDSVVVVLDKSYSSVNKLWSEDSFEGIEFDNVEDLTATDNEIHYELLASNEEFYQILRLDFVNDEISVEEVIGILEKDHRILEVSPNYEYELLASPTDPYYAIPTSNRGVKTLYQKIGAEDAWNITMGSSEITIGVMDSGIGYHEDLNCVAEGYSFTTADARNDTRNHGTAVAGIIGGTHNNGVVSAGIAPSATLIPLQVCDEDGEVVTSSVTQSVIYAILNQIDIINCSMGSPGFDDVLYRAMKMYKGLIVCAAGRGGADNDEQGCYPASFDLDNIISVAAVDDNDALSNGVVLNSNYGKSTVDLVAPGFKIPTTVDTTIGYDMISGTSIAAPFVSGTAALLLSYNPNLTAQELKTIIMESVDKIDSLTDKVASGGRLNIYNALLNTLQGDCVRHVTSKISIETEDPIEYLQIEMHYNAERFNLHTVVFDESISANAICDYSVEGKIVFYVLLSEDMSLPQDVVRCNFSTRQKFELTDGDIAIEALSAQTTDNQAAITTADIMKALLGDINCDNEINMADSNQMYHAVSGNLTATEQEILASDVNCDGIFNMMDVSEHLAYVNGDMTSFL